MELTQLLKKYRILPYLDSSRAEGIFPVIGALCSGGLTVLCLGAGNEGAYEALSGAVSTFDGMMLGAEVCDIAMAQSACKARAKFIISPGLSEEIAKQILLEDEIEILISLKSGEYDATAWGCDLTYDYVKINGDYRT